MTIISKCLAVLTATACLTFLGFVVVTTQGGTNWQGKMHGMDDFAFDLTESEEGNPIWTVTRRRDRKTVGTSPSIPPAALLEARKQKLKDQLAEMPALKTQIDQYQQKLTEAEQLNEIDVKSLAARLDELEKLIKESTDVIAEVARNGNQVAKNARGVQAEAEIRREDAMRLSNQLEATRSDIYGAVEQQKILRDLLIRLKEKTQRLQKRNDQLKQAIAK